MWSLRGTSKPEKASVRLAPSPTIAGVVLGIKLEIPSPGCLVAGILASKGLKLGPIYHILLLFAASNKLDIGEDALTGHQAT